MLLRDGLAGFFNRAQFFDHRRGRCLQRFNESGGEFFERLGAVALDVAAVAQESQLGVDRQLAY